MISKSYICINVNITFFFKLKVKFVPIRFQYNFKDFFVKRNEKKNQCLDSIESKTM